MVVGGDWMSRFRGSSRRFCTFQPPLRIILPYASSSHWHRTRPRLHIFFDLVYTSSWSNGIHSPPSLRLSPCMHSCVEDCPIRYSGPRLEGLKRHQKGCEAYKAYEAQQNARREERRQQQANHSQDRDSIPNWRSGSRQWSTGRPSSLRPLGTSFAGLRALAHKVCDTISIPSKITMLTPVLIMI